MIKNDKIRPISLIIIRKGDQILVAPGHDDIKNEDFCRIPGGGVEFGETSLEALKREMKEEFNAELINIKLKKVTENIFTFNEFHGHEICFIYEADFADSSLYEQSEFKILDKNNGTAFWADPKEIRLYPPDCLEL